MTSFRQLLAESTDKNTHLEHIEDFVLISGVKGARQAIDYLRSLRDALAGSAASKINTTIKYDGAPAIFAGTDPADGKFFVAKKGIFNKNPKVYKTEQEVRADTSGDLAEKLVAALRFLPALGIKNEVLQGDFLFGPGDVKKQVIQDQEYLTFHPNTIVYAVPSSSTLAKKISAAKIGIVWHTVYKGATFEDMKAVMGQKISSRLKQSKDVWHDDVLVKDLSGTCTLTKAETAELTSILSRAGKLFQGMNPSLLNDLSSNERTLMLVKQYNNTKIRAGEHISDPKKHVQDMISWMTQKLQAEVDSKKLPAAIERAKAELKAVMAYFAKHSPSDVAKIIELQSLLVEAKNYLLPKMSRLSSMNTFLRTQEGYRVTNQEGFVISDHLGKNAMKLVDRLEFSYANFSADVLKGFQTRK